MIDSSTFTANEINALSLGGKRMIIKMAPKVEFSVKQETQEKSRRSQVRTIETDKKGVKKTFYYHSELNKKFKVKGKEPLKLLNNISLIFQQ